MARCIIQAIGLLLHYIALVACDTAMAWPNCAIYGHSAVRCLIRAVIGFCISATLCMYLKLTLTLPVPQDPIDNKAPAVLVSAFNVTHLKETELELQKVKAVLQR